MADPIDREWIIAELKNRLAEVLIWHDKCAGEEQRQAEFAMAEIIGFARTVSKAPSAQEDDNKCEKCYWHIFAMGEIPNASAGFRQQCDGCPHTNTLKTATWIPRKDGAVCYCCRHIEGQYKYKQYRYCPWCGAKIIKEESG